MRAFHTCTVVDGGLFDQRGCLEPDRFALVFRWGAEVALDFAELATVSRT